MAVIDENIIAAILQQAQLGQSQPPAEQPPSVPTIAPPAVPQQTPGDRLIQILTQSQAEPIHPLKQVGLGIADALSVYAGGLNPNVSATSFLEGTRKRRQDRAQRDRQAQIAGFQVDEANRRTKEQQEFRSGEAKKAREFSTSEREASEAAVGQRIVDQFAFDREVLGDKQRFAESENRKDRLLRTKLKEMETTNKDSRLFRELAATNFQTLSDVRALALQQKGTIAEEMKTLSIEEIREEYEDTVRSQFVGDPEMEELMVAKALQYWDRTVGRAALSVEQQVAAVEEQKRIRDPQRGGQGAVAGPPTEFVSGLGEDLESLFQRLPQLR